MLSKPRRTFFLQVCRAWREVNAASSRVGGKEPGPVSAAAVAASAAVLSPEELTSQLLGWHLSRPLPDLLYIAAAVSELLAAAAAAGLPPYDPLQALQVDVMARHDAPDQAALSVYCCALSAGSPMSEGSPALLASLQAASQVAQAGSPMHSLGAASAAVIAAEELVISRHAHTASVAAITVRRTASASPYHQGSGISVAPNGGSTGVAVLAAAAAEAVVRRLLGNGQVLAAARAARRLPGGAVSADLARELLRATAVQRDEAAFVAVYRCFRDELMRWYPKLETARVQLMPV